MLYPHPSVAKRASQIEQLAGVCSPAPPFVRYTALALWCMPCMVSSVLAVDRRLCLCPPSPLCIHAWYPPFVRYTVLVWMCMPWIVSLVCLADNTEHRVMFRFPIGLFLCICHHIQYLPVVREAVLPWGCMPCIVSPFSFGRCYTA